MSAPLRAGALADSTGIDHLFETRDLRLRDHLSGRVARLRQVHGAEVHLLDDGTDLTSYMLADLTERPAGDALVTDTPGLVLAVATADCAPVLIADRVRGVIAAAHAGWRGVAAGVVPATVARMQERYGTRPADCAAAVGPCIGAECYEVGVEVCEAFARAGLADELFTPTRPGHWRCDLAGAVRQQLHGAGVETVEVVGRCTACDAQRFHSWRRDGATAGRMLAGIVRTAS